MNRPVKTCIAAWILLSMLVSCSASRRHYPAKYRKRTPCDCPTFGWQSPAKARCSQPML
ncbi:MAG: hypothetical protein LBS03_04495 [Bacteroidales bacterium]|nr:hypothetical protein [Bacteroidales bacterium]